MTALTRPDMTSLLNGLDALILPNGMARTSRATRLMTLLTATTMSTYIVANGYVSMVTVKSPTMLVMSFPVVVRKVLTMYNVTPMNFTT